MVGFWNIFCDESECSSNAAATCSSSFYALFSPFSCSNHLLIISTDILLSLILLFLYAYKHVARRHVIVSHNQHFSPVLYVSAIFNGVLALAYMGFGIWSFFEKLEKDQTVLPLDGWLVMLFQGFTWLLLTASVNKLLIPSTPAFKLCLILAFLFSGFLCISSLWEAIADKTMAVQLVLEMLSFPGAVLYLLSGFKGQVSAVTDADMNSGISYEPLPGDEDNLTSEIEFNDKGTRFSKAGFLSRMSFWWLNPLMKIGKEKLLADEDVPLLRPEDRAKTCYLMFMGKLRKRKEKSNNAPSMLLAIFFWQWKEIFVSGLFAMIKVLCLSAGPLYLKAFIEVAQGKTAFKYEGYVLTLALFLTKSLESLSERQWYFRTRLIGIQVRSMLCAAIYQKQLRLSNAAKMAHSSGEIVNYVTADAYRIGEFPYWFHQIWTTILQLCLALALVYYTVGLATVTAVIAIVLTVLASSPLVKMQHEYQRKLMTAQDRRLKAITEALANMKILKLYAWETHFMKVIEGLRKEEFQWISGILSVRGYHLVLFWSAPITVPAITFWSCYFLGIPLTASSVFTFLASLRIVQEPVRLIPDVSGVFIEAKVSFDRIVKFLEAPELQSRNRRHKCNDKELDQSIVIRSTEISWNIDLSLKPTLININLVIKPREKVAICGAVGSGKSTLLAAILGEVPRVNGTIYVYGKIAYVSQTAWIQTGSIQENILFGSAMDPVRYQEVLEKCSLVKDIEMLPFGDLTEIGERGVNLSGGQKQRIQLARALYQDADVYLLDDPFSAVDAHTATSLFNEYVIGALSEKTILLVTHQVDFLPAFDSILLMSAGEIIRAATYDQLLTSSREFQNLVNAHKDIAGSERQVKHGSGKGIAATEEIQKVQVGEQIPAPLGDQLIKKEERETGDTGLKPYKQYLSHSKGYLYFSLATIFHAVFILGQSIQSYWLAAEIQNSSVSRVELYGVYSMIGGTLAAFLLLRSFYVVRLGCGASESIFCTLLTSLFRSPMSFYDSTPLGRILSRVSADMSIIDIELAFKMTIALGSTMNTYFSFAILAVLTWPVLFVIIPMIYLSILLQRYYFASAKELMRINGTSKSSVASHLSESIAGAMTIRAFGEEDRFFSKHQNLIDRNASPYFHTIAANEWLVQRLEILCAIILSSSTLAIVLLHRGASASGFIGMELSYGLSLNIFLVVSVQFQCLLANLIISVERLEQYMHIPSEAPEVIESNRPPSSWPAVGKVEIFDLKVKYRPNAPLVLQGITCTIEGGHKVGIVGRTGSGKTTLISALFRLVEPTAGRIVIDDIDISTIGLHDLRSHFAIIPQDPTLFVGSVRYNLDPLSEYADQEIWEAHDEIETTSILTNLVLCPILFLLNARKVLEKCHFREAIEEKKEGLNSLVAQDGSNWSMGQRQLFCLGRALLKRSKILVLDEATASIDNTTDSILQKTIRTEFADCTVITVAHRIPTVMDCNMVLAISDGKLVEYDEPLKLMSKEGSLFGQLVREYWSRTTNCSTY